MTDPNARTAPGWYADPYREAPLRWWDGTQWTAQVGGGGGGAQPRPVYAPTRRPLPADTPVYTPWIWLVVFLPLVSVLLSFAWNPVGVTSQYLHGMTADPQHPMMNMTALYTPAYFVSILLGWIAYAAIIVAAWLDYRELGRRGVDRPFHWAWSFLLPQVYSIGRSVIVRRVAGGRGAAPIWASIAVIVVSLLASVALAVLIVAVVLQSLPTPSGVGA